LNLESGVAYSLNNIGNVYENLKDNDKALEYYLESLEIREKINDIKGISISLNSIAIVSNKLGDNNKAFIYAQKSLKLAQELGYPENIRNASKLLTEIYKKQGNSAKALEMYELYNLMKDSLNNEETKKQSLKQQYKYEFEKKETILKANQDKKNLIHANQTKRQKIIIVAIVIGLIVLIAFLAFVYNRYKITQKQKEIISLKEKETLKQKLLVEQKNKEILDSITYAKRIQSAILPQPKLVKEYLKESFILYKPKDIVAGDFYWFEVIDNLIFFAAADCTGHGVPGAMVSVVCHNALNRSVKEFSIKNPAEILNKTREIVVSEFEKSDENVKDGMDISLCVLNINSFELHWAGAHNPLWIIRKNKENSGDTCQLIELKADKQPIGKFAYSKPFTDHTVKLYKEDIIYIFTDGFQDQFGGEKGKKYKVSQLRELLLSISSKNLEEQKNIIDQNFETWKGELDQVDDVCLMGVKI
jgi:serine phosphatase RsbU (regulator of sigma subunit)